MNINEAVKGLVEGSPLTAAFIVEALLKHSSEIIAKGEPTLVTENFWYYTAKHIKETLDNSFKRVNNE